MSTEQMMRAFAAWWEEVEIFSMRSERLIGLEKPALAEISFAEGWQAAMRQAVPEGYCVVPVEPTPEWVRNFDSTPEHAGLAEKTISDVIATAPKGGEG